MAEQQAASSSQRVQLLRWQAESSQALAEIAPKREKALAKGRVDELRSQVKMAQERNAQHVEQVGTLQRLRERWRERERKLEEAGVSFSVARLRDQRARSPTSPDDAGQSSTLNHSRPSLVSRPVARTASESTAPSPLGASFR